MNIEYQVKGLELGTELEIRRKEDSMTKLCEVGIYLNIARTSGDLFPNRFYELR